MKPSRRLTLRFVSYFTVFYLLIILGFIVSLLFFCVFLSMHVLVIISIL